MISRKLVLTLTIFSLILISPVFASDEPTIEWEKAVDVSRPTHISGQALTSDGGLIMVGSRSYGDSRDGILIKVDSDGNKVWEKTLVTDEDDYLSDVKQTSDGGYIAIGTFCSDYFHDDAWIIKTDSLGQLEWQYMYESTVSDYGSSILEDSNGDFVWVGSRIYQDYYRISYGKLSPTGEPINKTFTEDVSMGYKIIETSDGGYVIAGAGRPSAYYGWQLMIMKLNQTMGEEWISYQGYAGSRYLRDIVETDEGNFVGVGYKETDDTGVFLLHEVDPEGNVVDFLYLTDYELWYGTDIVQLNNGDFVVSGRAIGEEFTCFMAGIDSDLELEWIHEFDDPEIELSGMVLNRANKLLFCGTLEGDIDMPAILKTGFVGDVMGSITFNVMDEAGNPISGASINTLMKTLGGISGSTDQTGTLVCEEVNPGSYSVQVSAEGYETATVQFECVSGESTVVSVTLNSSEQEPENGVHILSITVQDDAGVPLRSVHIITLASPVGQEEVEADTNTAGEAQLELIEGAYELKLSKSTYEVKVFELTITEDQLVTVIMDKEEETTETAGETTDPEVTEQTGATETPGDDTSNIVVLEQKNSNNMLIYGGAAAVALIGVAVYMLKTKGVF